MTKCNYPPYLALRKEEYSEVNKHDYTEERIIVGALAKLNEQTELKCSVDKGNGALVIEGYHGGVKEFLFILLIPALSEKNIDWVVRQARTNDDNVIVSKIVSNKISTLLFQKGIRYLDAAGNCFLKTPNAYIHFKGFKLSENDNYKEVRNIAFSTKGLMVLFLYLSSEWFANLTVRQIENISGVSRGTVSLVNRNLLKLGFLSQENGDFKLMNRSKLFEKWAMYFNDKLKYKLIIGRYRTDNFNFWEKANIDHEVVSGEVGAAQLFPEISAANGVIYTSNPDDLISRYDLIESDTGDIELRRKFWDDSESSNYKVDIRLLIYTDVVLANNILNKEQVNTLRTMIEEGMGVTH